MLGRPGTYEGRCCSAGVFVCLLALEDWSKGTLGQLLCLALSLYLGSELLLLELAPLDVRLNAAHVVTGLAWGSGQPARGAL